ncbi:MAG: GerMN domain-containing protein, partial [Treponemataceae bacterium]|nr:GerMN domain-containing protein [Treponemataceae bacterium]
MNKIDSKKVINYFADSTKHVKLLTLVLLLLIFILFLVSNLFFAIKGYSTRRVFLFEGMDKNCIYAENRYYPHVKKIDKVELYVEELVLGPVGNRYKNLFAPGTKVNECFVRGRTLYVDLSKEALFPDETTSQITQATEIFKKNIFRNFRKIDIIK